MNKTINGKVFRKTLFLSKEEDELVEFIKDVFNEKYGKNYNDHDAIKTVLRLYGNVLKQEMSADMEKDQPEHEEQKKKKGKKDE